MNIIVVGPDGAGKTTLCKKLAEKFDLEYIKRDKPQNEEEKKNMLKSYMDVITTKNNFIYDRYIYCEKVYGPVMRDENIVSWEDIVQLELELLKKGTIIIHCTDTTDILWKRCNTRGEDYVTSWNQLDKIRRSYHKVLQRSMLPVFEYYVGISVFGE